VVESHVALETGLLFNLSPQQLVACAPNDDHCGGVGGCLGSIPELAFDYLVDVGGMAEEWSWGYESYTGATNGTCNELNPIPNSNPTKAGIGGYIKLEENDANAVMTALAAVGPLAINVDASVWSAYEVRRQSVVEDHYCLPNERQNHRRRNTKHISAKLIN